jgi:hypothetical protein
MSVCSDLWLDWSFVEAAMCPYTQQLGGLFHLWIIACLFGAIYVAGRDFGLPGVLGILLSGYVIQTLPARFQLPAYSLMGIVAGIALYRAYSNPQFRGYA